MGREYGLVVSALTALTEQISVFGMALDVGGSIGADRLYAPAPATCRIERRTGEEGSDAPACDLGWHVGVQDTHALSVKSVVEFADIAIGDVFEAALRFVVDNADHADFSKIRDAMPR